MAVEKLVFSLKSNFNLYRKSFKLLLAKLNIWVNGNFETQKFIFDKFKSYLSSSNLGLNFCDILVTDKLLRVLDSCYYITPKRDSIIRKTPLSSEELMKLREYIFSLIRSSLFDINGNIKKSKVRQLFRFFFVNEIDNSNYIDITPFITDLVNNKQISNYLMELGGVELFISLLQKKIEGSRILGLKIIISLLSLLPKKSVNEIITNEFSIKLLYSLGNEISNGEYNNNILFINLFYYYFYYIYIYIDMNV